MLNTVADCSWRRFTRSSPTFATLLALPSARASSLYTVTRRGDLQDGFYVALTLDTWRITTFKGKSPCSREFCSVDPISVATATAPYAKERERYLRLLMEEGRAQPTLRQIANLLYHMAEQIPLSLPSATPSQIEAAARQWSTALVRCRISRHRMETKFVFHATNWLRMLGRFQQPVSQLPFTTELDPFLHFEQQEHGLADASLMMHRTHLRLFLNWAADHIKTLRKITPEDISRYFGRPRNGHGSGQPFLFMSGHCATSFVLLNR